MIFGKIDYLNLLPFLVFMKRCLRHSSQRAAFFNKVGVPSAINSALRARRVDAGFISSIRSKGKTCFNAGIIAKKEVRSVLVKPAKSLRADAASNTSNELARILNVKGEVVIGDRGLKLWLEDKTALDLALLWQEKTGLPFVFARLCCVRNCRLVKKISASFLRQRVKIPRYILNRQAQKTQIPPREILDYLKVISYKIGTKEKLALKKFFFLSRTTPNKMLSAY